MTFIRSPISVPRTIASALVLAAIFLFALFGCAAPQLTEGDVPRSYRISPSQVIQEFNTILITLESLDKLVKMSDEDLKRVESLFKKFNGGKVQSMGAWGISVSASSKTDRDQTQRADAKADISPTVTLPVP